MFSPVGVGRHVDRWHSGCLGSKAVEGTARQGSPSALIRSHLLLRGCYWRLHRKPACTFATALGICQENFPQFRSAMEWTSAGKHLCTSGLSPRIVPYLHRLESAWFPSRLQNGEAEGRAERREGKGKRLERLFFWTKLLSAQSSKEHEKSSSGGSGGGNCSQIAHELQRPRGVFSTKVIFKPAL